MLVHMQFINDKLNTDAANQIRHYVRPDVSIIKLLPTKLSPILVKSGVKTAMRRRQVLHFFARVIK